MNIKKTADLLINFAIKRLAEILGITVFIAGIMLLLALASYSPEDPNFIFPDGTKIKNLLGFNGSFISDLFFQSIGLIAYLFSFTFIVTGFNIFKRKEFFLLKSKSTSILQLTSALANAKAVNPLPSMQTVIIFLILTIKIR